MSNKSLTITLIVILSVFALVITGGLVFILVKGEDFRFVINNDVAVNMNLVDSYETKIEEVDKIYLNLVSTDVEIKESENEKILLEYYSNKENNAKIEYSNNTIKLDEQNYRTTCIGFCNIRRKVILYLPKEYKNEIEIITVSGDINSEIDLTENKTKIETTSGDVKIKSVDNIDIKTISGDVKVENTKNIDVKTTSGDIEIKDVQETLNIKTISGDVTIDTLSIKEQSNINTTSGDVKIKTNETNCYVEVETTSGDKNINSSDRKSDIVLKVKTISGDISVN